MITKQILVLVLGIAIATPLIIFLTPKDDEYDVVLLDGEHFKATHINWYSSGHVDITRENGERLLVPECRVKKIKVIEDEEH